MRLSLAQKLNLLLSLLILVAGGINGWLFVDYQIRSKTEELEKRAVAVTRNLAYNSEYKILVEDRAGLEQLFLGLLDSSDIVSGRALNSEDTVLFEGERGKARSVRTFTAPVTTRTVSADDMLLPTLPNEAGGETVGRVELAFSLDQLESDISRLRKTTVLFVIVVIALLTSSTSFIIRLFLKRPLATLVDGMKEIGSGNLRHTIELAARDEMGLLAGSFNQMAKNLSETVVSRNFLDSVFRSMTDTLIVVDGNDRIQNVNGAAAALLGYSQEEMVGMPFGRVMVRWGELSGDAEPTIRNREASYLSRDGREIPVLFSKSPLSDSGSALTGRYVCVAVDITERKRYELALQASSRELARKNEELKEFLFIAAHDLQEPLRKVLTIASRLPSEMEGLSEKGRHLFSRLNVSTEKMSRLIEDLRLFSEITYQGCTWSFVPLYEVLREVTEGFKAEVDFSSVSVEASGLPEIEGDRERMRRLFSNLMDNSLRFRSEAPLRISVRSEMLPEGFCRIDYSDTGKGFASEYAEKIFEVFQKLDSRSEDGGTGMGLPVCRKIVELHGGTISAWSRKGEGAHFTIVLPLRQIIPVATDRAPNHEIPSLPIGKRNLGMKEPGSPPAEGLYEKIFDSIDEAVFLCTEEMKIAGVNRAALALLQKEEGEVLGRGFGDFFASAQDGDQDGAPGGTEARVLTPSGPRIVDISCTRIAPEGERAGFRVFLVRDVTERKKADQEMIGFARRLEESNRELTDFAYTASHDLQEPLRKVKTFGDRLKAKSSAELGEQGLNYLDRMQKAAERMQVLIDDLLSYSRVTTKGEPLVPTDLNRILKEVLGDLEIKIQEVDARITCDPLPPIEADPLQMRQLFQNLLGNALKFRRQGVQPAIHVGAENVCIDDFPFCRISVSDNGIGFDEKYLDRIFAVFQRLHGRGEYEGSGVGLAICRKIVRRHGGEITATGSPNGGSTFIFTLPLSRPQQGSADAGKEEKRGNVT